MVKKREKLQKKLQNSTKMITFCTKVVKKLQKNDNSSTGSPLRPVGYEG
jgi:hypothetical protein